MSRNTDLLPVDQLRLLLATSPPGTELPVRLDKISVL